MSRARACNDLATEEPGREWQWQLPLWCGMDVSGWLRLLRRNRFAVDPRRLHRCALISACAVGNTILGHLQDLRWARRVREAEIVHAPLFVVGHWRSGTSWLHELLAQDPGHVVPSTFACFFPHHFLLTEPFATRFLRFLLPTHRPMDNMPMSWEGPLEDEYAMCNLGERSPYLAIAFPNERHQDRDYLDLRQVSREEIERWQRSFVRFLKHIAVRTTKRIVLKSPPHTCRIPVLLELFPDARFVHIVRDPFVVFASTLNLWRRLYRYQGLQEATLEGLEDHVLETYLHVFDTLQESRAMVSDSRFCELRYEDLVADPVGRLRAVYDHLDLGDYDRVVPRLEAHLRNTVDYRTNRYRLTPEQRERIGQRCGHIIARYGYAQ